MMNPIAFLRSGGLAYGLAVVMFLCFIYVGVMGVDFGPHFDEPYLLEGLTQSVESLTLLPQRYIYNGVYFALGFAAFSPEIAEFGTLAAREIRAHPTRPFDLAAYPRIREAQSRLISFLRTKPAILRVRTWYIVFSALTVLWVFGLTTAISRSPWAGLLGAGVLVSSWEFAYHARFAAVDIVLAMLLTLCVFLAVMVLETESPQRRRWLQTSSAVALGVAMGTKAGAMVGIVPLVLSVVLSSRVDRPLRLALRIFTVTSIALAVYILTTPGLFLDPVRVLNDWTREIGAYSRVSAGYTYYIGGYGTHAVSILRYLALSAMFPFIWVSVALFAAAIAGAGLLLAKSRSKFLVFVSFPVAYLLIIAGANLFIVRNYQVLLPFAATCAAFAIWKCLLMLRSYRFVFVACICAIATVCLSGIGFQVAQASTVRRIESEEAVLGLRAYLSAHPAQTVAFSSRLRKAVGANSSLDQVESPRYCAFYYNEADPYDYVVSKTPGLFAAVFGSHEVNYDYYPTWGGQNFDTRILITKTADAARIGINCGNTLHDPAVARLAARGAEVVGYIDCRRKDELYSRHGLEMAVIEGEPFTWDVRPYGLNKFDAQGLFGWNRVAFSVKRLDPASKYSLAVRWWSFDGPDRVQSITVTSLDGAKSFQVLRPTPVPGYLDLRSKVQPGRMPESLSADMPTEAYRDGGAVVSVMRDGGANAVLSDLWILKWRCM
ncbi:MAG TPA: phospholipid carrier-dependent glycosyltransferase [Bryobacteraceae bacterium]|nr:phospholipid carrier-dependent glycosyltransferase [Bryobacteraceae bacterium]